MERIQYIVAKQHLGQVPLPDLARKMSGGGRNVVVERCRDLNDTPEIFRDTDGCAAVGLVAVAQLTVAAKY